MTAFQVWHCAPMRAWLSEKACTANRKAEREHRGLRGEANEGASIARSLAACNGCPGVKALAQAKDAPQPRDALDLRGPSAAPAASFGAAAPTARKRKLIRPDGARTRKRRLEKGGIEAMRRRGQVEDDEITADEVAGLLGVSRPSARKRLAGAGIEPVHPPARGQVTVYKRVAVQAWIDDNAPTERPQRAPHKSVKRASLGEFIRDELEAVRKRLHDARIGAAEAEKAVAEYARLVAELEPMERGLELLQERLAS